MLRQQVKTPLPQKGGSGNKVIVVVGVLALAAIGIYIFASTSKKTTTTTPDSTPGLELGKATEVGKKIFGFGKEVYSDAKAKKEAKKASQEQDDKDKKSSALKSAGLKTY